MPTTAPPNLYMVTRSGPIGYEEPCTYVVASRGPAQARKAAAANVMESGMYGGAKFAASFLSGTATHIGRAKYGTRNGAVILQDWTSA